MAGRLEQFFTKRTSGSLRSIVIYKEDEFDVAFLRDDVAAEYSEHDVAAAVDDSRMESLMAPVYGDLYTEDHDELVCTMKVFPSVVEMNFVLSSGEGIAVALDSGSLAESEDLVTEAREVASDDGS
ncbi:hypothetical protein ACH9L7_06280 [Haloferax sp. S1W]|uniref:hypothetical protein n=1 Tax=Haloferax sp. S1W TaxID=3377110 RepID=UPI0037CC21D5